MSPLFDPVKLSDIRGDTGEGAPYIPIS